MFPLSFLGMRSVFAAPETQVKVIMNQTYVLPSQNYPTREEVKSVLVEGVHYAVLEYGDILLVLDGEQNIGKAGYVRVETDKLPAGFGYVYGTYVMNNADSSLVSLPDTNATVNKDNAVFYQINGLDGNLEEILVPHLLAKGDRVQLTQGYDRSKEKLECRAMINGTVMKGYILRDDVDVRGISIGALVGAIIGVIALIGLLILLRFYLKRRKKKKRMLIAGQIEN